MPSRAMSALRRTCGCLALPHTPPMAVTEVHVYPISSSLLHLDTTRETVAPGTAETFYFLCWKGKIKIKIRIRHGITDFPPRPHPVCPPLSFLCVWSGFRLFSETNENANG